MNLFMESECEHLSCVVSFFTQSVSYHSKLYLTAYAPYMKELKSLKNWLMQTKASGRNNKLRPRRNKAYTILLDADAGHKNSFMEAVRSQTGKDIHRVDLSKLISQYIGETEKNLSVVFKEAEQKDSVLFFDEADALFGKRTTVKDSHDRYANREVKAILDKLESFPGIVILSTNRKQNIDKAFLRRFSSIPCFDEA
jgi:SpoVK/Ycf46/Vps4 family AAA+-type ATPase